MNDGGSEQDTVSTAADGLTTSGFAAALTAGVAGLFFAAGACTFWIIVFVSCQAEKYYHTITYSKHVGFYLQEIIRLFVL